MRTDGFQPATRIFAFFLLLALAIPGCRHKHTAPLPAGEASETQTYLVRGIVEKLPDARTHPRQITIKSEAVDNFIGPDGHPSPMAAMVMDYPLAKAVSINGLAPGSKVTFTYQVNWNGGIDQITRIQKLSASTKLNFTATSAAKP